MRTQVWTALIAMLLLRYLQLRAKYRWSLSNLAALLRQQLFVHRDVGHGTVLVLDRGYLDYQWFIELSRRQVYFVTRLKDNAVYEVVEQRAVPQRGNVVADEVIFFSSQAEAGPEYFFRRVEIDDPTQGRPVFLTNYHKQGATTVAAVYKDRRRFLKRNLWPPGASPSCPRHLASS